jgi:hypothetical protein
MSVAVAQVNDGTIHPEATVVNVPAAPVEA